MCFLRSRLIFKSTEDADDAEEDEEKDEVEVVLLALKEEEDEEHHDDEEEERADASVKNETLRNARMVIVHFRQ